MCEQLSGQTGETVTLAVLTGSDVVTIDQVNLSSSVISIDWFGRTTGLHVTSTGKVFLAWLPERIRENVLHSGLERMTDRAVTPTPSGPSSTPSAGAGGRARKRNSASTQSRRRCTGPTARCSQRICVSGPVFRLTHERLHDVGWLTADAARQIRRRSGATESHEA